MRAIIQGAEWLPLVTPSWPIDGAKTIRHPALLH